MNELKLQKAENMTTLDTLVPLTDIEAVLAWVDTFKLSRPTKKINRDFSDAVLLAEILSVHYPKLVEMHNYPPRNSHSLKLNNWMTLNRKVLKKLKLNLCCDTMDKLANSTPGIIERVLIMVRDRIRRDEELNKSLKENDENLSSGGSYYEASGDDNILLVPIKTRVNGIVEIVQHKVVSHESYLSIKEELKDAKESADTLKQKVDHLDSLIKLKDERIEELQKQLDRKQTRRKEVEVLVNSLPIPFDLEPPTPKVEDLVPIPSKTASLKSIDAAMKLTKAEESKIPLAKTQVVKFLSKPSLVHVQPADLVRNDLQDYPEITLDKVKSDVFEEIEIMDEKYTDMFHDSHDYLCDPDCFPLEEAVMQEEVRSKQEEIQNISYFTSSYDALTNKS